MDITTAIALASLLLGGGVGTGLWRYSVAHAREHQQIKDRLEWGREEFDKNKEDHEEIKDALDKIDEKLDKVGVAVNEILVASGDRRPGAGINGKK